MTVNINRASQARDGGSIVHQGRQGEVEDSSGFAYRRGEVMVRSGDEPLVATELRKRGATLVRRAAGVSLFRVPDGDDVLDLVARLRNLDGRPSVSPNRVMRAALHDQWGPATPAEPADPLDDLPDGNRLAGSDVRVGIIDTGLDLRTWFKNRAHRASGDQDAEELDEDKDGALDFDSGHGTHVTGIVLQHAPGANVFVRGVIDTHGHLDDADASDAIIELVRQHRVDILNLSFGGYTREESGMPSTRGALEEARTINPELIVVAAAGNDGLRQPFFPAAYPDVVAVGALDAHGRQARFSNRGSDWVDCCTRGTDVVSTFLDWNGPRETEPHHDEDTQRRARPRRLKDEKFEGFARWTGTSFAAPRISGAIAAAMSPEGKGRELTGPEAVAKVVHEPSLERSEDMGTIVNPTNFVGQSTG
jgi:subtilisin family serine protease